MTLAIKLDDEKGVEEGFFIFFDAVTNYTKGKKGQLTKNPIAGGRKPVTDHFVKDNYTYSFSAVVSFSDISSTYSLVRDEGGFVANNAIDQPNAVTIKDSSNKLLNYLPTSISQFIPKSNSKVTLDEVRTNYKDYVETCLTRLMSGEITNKSTGLIQTKIRPIAIYEFIGTALDKIIKDVCLTDFTITETVETGNSLNCQLQFEEVKFAKLKTTALSPDVISALKSKSAGKAKKGNVPSKDASSNDVPTEQEGEDKLIKAAATGGKE